MRMLFKPWAVKYLLRLWPPYWGMGIRVEHVSEDFRRITVTMKFAWWNRNYVGTQFGGSLFAMTDPFYMLMLHKALEPDYFVWDKAAHIDFVKPGKSKVTARFEIDDAIIQDIWKNTANGEKYFKDLCVDIVDASGEVVARVRRTLYLRKKPHLRNAQ